MTIKFFVSILMLCFISFNINAQKDYKKEWTLVDSLEKKGLYINQGDNTNP